MPGIVPESVLILEEAAEESALRLGSKGFLTISSLSILLSPADFRDSPVGPPLELFLNKEDVCDDTEDDYEDLERTIYLDPEAPDHPRACSGGCDLLESALGWELLPLPAPELYPSLPPHSSRREPELPPSPLLP